MVDGGLGVDICPLSTLQRMEIGTGKIRPNNICVRAFDGIKRDTFGEIDLVLTIGPVDFEVTFQVLDMDTSYNFLLGRTWIHATGAVPSTLHQMVKFEYEDQEIMVYGEDEQSIYRDPSIPCLEAREGSEHIVYQAFKVVVADQYEERSPCPQPFLSNASIMVEKEMIKHGFKPGKGLGKALQGISEPITLPTTEKFFGIGFHPTPEDEDWADERKIEGWALPHPLPHLYQTFVKPKYSENEDGEAFTAEEIKDICGAMRQMLYETNIVQLGEGTSTTEVLYMGPDGKLMGFIVSRRGIELDLTKIKAIRDLPPPRTKKDVMSLLGRLNYISRFIAQLNTTCEPIFKLLKKDATIKWTSECQEAFDKVKEYLSNPPVLVPPEAGRPLFLYMSVLENSFGCVLRQHDITNKKERAIYYLSKKLDPLKYLFQKPMPTGRLAKWQIFLTEFDIVYITRMVMKAQALADYLAEKSVDKEYQPLSTYFLDEEHYPATARLRFFCTNNIAEYEACIMGMNMAIDQDVEDLLIMEDADLIIRQA
ncbi:uncharacterized protein LOC142166018 [Nicotiana tabacum]|uniref:Uncharacterized protein LOC142166018 n=1 Tax=Nicotiana tabacum TaxID=4097 RepID=A0AC58S6F6_TOBAC